MQAVAGEGLPVGWNGASAMRLWRGKRMADEERKASPVMSWITANLNVSTLLACCGIAYAVLNGNIQQERDIADIKRDRMERAVAADRRFTNIEESLRAASQQNVPYRLTVVEGDVKAVNSRIDELARQVTAGFNALREANVSQTDLMRRDISALAGDVRVLTTKLESAIRPRQPVYIAPSDDQADSQVYPATMPPGRAR